ncbi:hypothetical protein ACVWVP_004054 [Pseudomonas sp. TE24901]
MSGISSLSSSTSPLPLQAAPEALRMRPAPGTTDTSNARFTVTFSDQFEAKEIFTELARKKAIGVELKSDDLDYLDLGDGTQLHVTFDFRFKPNGPNGTFSPALQMRIDDFRREFQQKLQQAGIRNYAPES